LKDMIAGIIDKISSAFMKNLYGLFEAGNIDEVKDIMRTDEFGRIAGNATETEPAFYSPTSAGTAKSGKGVGIYRIQDGYFVYYGDYADNVRGGQGMWLYVWSDSFGNYDNMFEGQWAGDKPNGNGKEEYRYIGGNDISVTVIQGTYENGLENGTITVDEYSDEGVHHNFQYTATAGVAHRESDERSYPDGTYPIAISADGTGFSQREGDRMGVSGFSISAGQE